MTDRTLQLAAPLLLCLGLGWGAPAGAQEPTPTKTPGLTPSQRAEALGAARVLLEEASFAEEHERRRERARELYARAEAAARQAQSLELAREAAAGVARCSGASAKQAGAGRLPVSAYSLLARFHLEASPATRGSLLLHGKRLVPVLQELIRTGRTYGPDGTRYVLSSEGAIDLLSWVKDPSAEAALLRLVQAKDPVLRRQAVGKLDAKRHRRVLERVLQEERVDAIRQAALYVISRSEPSEWSLGIMRSAARAGSSIGCRYLRNSPLGFEELLALLRDPQVPVSARDLVARLIDDRLARQGIEFSLGRLGSDQRSRFLQALKALVAYCDGPVAKLDRGQLVVLSEVRPEIWPRELGAGVARLLFAHPPGEAHSDYHGGDLPSGRRGRMWELFAQRAGLEGLKLVFALRGSGTRHWLDNAVVRVAETLDESQQQLLLAWVKELGPEALSAGGPFWRQVLWGMVLRLRKQAPLGGTLRRRNQPTSQGGAVQLWELLLSHGGAEERLALLKAVTGSYSLDDDQLSYLGEFRGLPLGLRLEKQLLSIRAQDPPTVDDFLEVLGSGSTVRIWLRAGIPLERVAKVLDSVPESHEFLVQALQDPALKGDPVEVARLALDYTFLTFATQRKPQEQIMSALKARFAGALPPRFHTLLPSLVVDSPAALKASLIVLRGETIDSKLAGKASMVLAKRSDPRLFEFLPRLWKSAELTSAAKQALPWFRYGDDREQLLQGLLKRLFATSGAHLGEPGLFLLFPRPIKAFLEHREALKARAWHEPVLQALARGFKSGELPPKDFAQVLPRADDKPSRETRRILAEVIGHTANPGGTQFLDRCLKDPDPKVRAAAQVAALELAKAREAEEELARRLTGVESPALRELLELAASERASTAEVALTTLGKVGGQEVLPRLIRLLEAASADERRAPIRAAIEAITRRLERAPAPVRGPSNPGQPGKR